MMIGHDLPRLHRRPRSTDGSPLLGVVALEVDDDRGLRAVRGVDLEVAAGEILGIAGVAGNGQVQLAEAIVGLRRVRSGRTELGAPPPRLPASASSRNEPSRHFRFRLTAPPAK
jgi:simple sugar transport system ATP-binding protein